MDDSSEKIVAKVNQLAAAVVSHAARHTAFQMMVLARIEALQGALVPALEQLGVRSPGQSLDIAICNAARERCESQLAEFSDSDPALASELRAYISRFLDDTDTEHPIQ